MRRLIIYLSLTCVAVIAVLPIVWGLSTALKPHAEVESYPPRWIPAAPTLDNFRAVVSESGVRRQFLNSGLVGAAVVLVGLVIGTHAAYAIARFTFPGSQCLAFAILMTSMVPGISILVPLYYLASAAKLYDTYAILILVYASWQVPTIMWLLKGFFETVPRELDESALIDGCSRWTAFYRVVVPVSQPGLAAAGLLTFIFVWNDFLIAFTLTVSESKRMIAVGLYQYISQYGVDWASLMAAVVLALVPVILLFGLLQRGFISGLTAGAMKG